MKSTVIGIFGVFLLLFVVCGTFVCSRTVGTFGVFSGPPEYSFKVDGDHLSVINMSDPPEFDLVKGPPPPVKIEQQDQSVGRVIAITYRGKIHWHKFVDGVGSAFWSSQKQAVFFEATVSSGRPENTYPKGEIWKWMPKRGFVRILQTATPIESLYESIDGNYLCGATSGFDAKYENKIMTYCFQTRKVQYLKSDASWTVRDMISPTKFLDTDGGVINGETGHAEPLPYSNCAAQAVAFQGSVWVIYGQDSKYSVLRLNSDLKKVEQTIPFPSDFPRRARGYE